MNEPFVLCGLDGNCCKISRTQRKWIWFNNSSFFSALYLCLGSHTHHLFETFNCELGTSKRYFENFVNIFAWFLRWRHQWFGANDWLLQSAAGNDYLVLLNRLIQQNKNQYFAPFICLQIFYPYSIQTHEHEYPGEDPGDCPRNIKRDQ